MTRIEELTLRYLDGELTPKEVEELEELLRDDAEARRTHLALLETARALRAAAPPADLAERVGAHVRASAERQIREGVLHRIDRRVWMKRGLAAAAALLLAVAGYVALGRPELARLEMAGRSPRVIREGDSIEEQGAGTLTFTDGSVLKLSGVTHISDVSSTLGVGLRRGDIEADILPQAPGRPFTLRTPSALLAVVGTKFRLRVDAVLTTLTVTEGRVRFKRMDDGVESLVSAGQAAEAGGRVLRWNFDGDGQDAPGTLDKAPRVPGRRGEGIRCGLGGLDAPTAAFGERWALSLWLREASIGREACAYLATGPRPGDLLLERVGTLSPTHFRARVGDKVLNATLPVKGGEWFQLALSWDGQDLRLLHNGQEAGRLALPSNPAPRAGLRIGASAVPGVFDVDEIRIDQK